MIFFYRKVRKVADQVRNDRKERKVLNIRCLLPDRPVCFVIIALQSCDFL